MTKPFRVAWGFLGGPEMKLKFLLATLILLGIATPVQAVAVEPVAAAEVKVGLEIHKYEVSGISETFKVAAGTRIFAWTRVSGALPGTEVEVIFAKDGQAKFSQKLAVPHLPYRTHAFRTFRAGDGGAWTAKVVDAEGKELGGSAFKVEIE